MEIMNVIGAMVAGVGALMFLGILLVGCGKLLAGTRGERPFTVLGGWALLPLVALGTILTWAGAVALWLIGAALLLFLGYVFLMAFLKFATWALA